jgi:LysR family transcriptional regulator, benzoate and cis,cis-muconate-responsive activator of ben and cat genes
MKDLSLRQLECFLEVCRDFHFTRAAARLHLAQPPLSRHIRDLEATIGVQLFRRSGRAVSLTPAGEAFLGEVCGLPMMLNRAVDAARRASEGEEQLLRIGFVAAILGEGLLDFFQRFRQRWRSIRLELVDHGPQALVERLLAGELDGAFLGLRPVKLSPLLQSLEWKKEAVVVCLPHGHAAAGCSSMSLKEVALESQVVLAATVAPAYREWMESLFARRGVRPRIVQETNAATAVLSLVVAGCGIALLPMSSTLIAGNRMVTVPLDEPDAWIREVFVYRKEASSLLDPLLGMLQEEGQSMSSQNHVHPA